MFNVLGQDIQVGTPVVRGGATRSSSIQRIGRVIKVDNARSKVSVKWEFTLDEIPRPSGEASRSSVSVHDVVAVSDEALDRVQKVWEASEEFTRNTPRPMYANTTGLSYFSPEYKKALKDYESLIDQWNSDRKNYINHVLTRLGFVPMP